MCVLLESLKVWPFFFLSFFKVFAFSLKKSRFLNIFAFFFFFFLFFFSNSIRHLLTIRVQLFRNIVNFTSSKSF